MHYNPINFRLRLVLEKSVTTVKTNLPLSGVRHDNFAAFVVIVGYSELHHI